MGSEFVLRGLDGANPLAFLASIGTLRVGALKWPESEIALRWVRDSGWVPVLSNAPARDELDLSQALLETIAVPSAVFEGLGSNITVPCEVFAQFAHESFAAASRKDRNLADFCSSFGCEALPQEKGDRIQYTQFCFITGSGHQDFLGTFNGLRDQVTAAHVHHALFEAMDDRDRSLSFRWSPNDAKEYSLLWQDPSKTGVYTTWGANLLAFEALPLYPTMPGNRRLETTGFRRDRGQRFPEFSWPIWEDPLTLDEVRSLVALAEIHSSTLDSESLSQRGITQVFRSLRVRIPPDGSNFKVSFRPARAM